MIDLLAAAASVPPDDALIPASVLISIVPAVITAVIGGLVGKKISDSKKITIDPLPLPIELAEKIATKEELDALEARIFRELKNMEEALSKERDIARIANGNIHKRIDTSTVALAEMRGELKQIAEGMSRLLDIATKRRS